MDGLHLLVCTSESSQNFGDSNLRVHRDREATIAGLHKQMMTSHRRYMQHPTALIVTGPTIKTDRQGRNREIMLITFRPPPYRPVSKIGHSDLVVLNGCRLSTSHRCHQLQQTPIVNSLRNISFRSTSASIVVRQVWCVHAFHGPIPSYGNRFVKGKVWTVPRWKRPRDSLPDWDANRKR